MRVRSKTQKNIHLKRRNYENKPIEQNCIVGYGEVGKLFAEQFKTKAVFFTFEFCITWYQTTVRCTDRHPWGALYKSGRDDIGAFPLAKDARWQDYANHLIEAKCD